MEEARMLKERNKKNILFKLGTYETNLEYVLRRNQQEQRREGNDLRERNSEGISASTWVVAL